MAGWSPRWRATLYLRHHIKEHNICAYLSFPFASFPLFLLIACVIS